MQKNKNRPGYKKTKVGWIPQDWTPSTLGHSEHFITSGSRGWSPYYSDSGDLFVRITNLTRDTINLDYSDCRFVSLPAISSEGTRTRLRAGDILISITADLGIIAYFSDIEPYPNAYVNQHVALLRLLDENICPEFVAHQLASPRSQQRFRQITDQGAKAGLNLPAIRSFPVALPSLPEQKAIAEVLECWDKAIREYERKIEKKRNIKKGLMHRLFGQIRFGGDNRKRYIHEFVTEICVRNKKQSINRVLSVTNKRGFVLPEEQFARTVASSNLSNYKVITRGQYAYNPSRINVGSIARLDKWSEGVLSPMYTVFKIENSIVHTDFFLQWLSTHEANQRIKNSAQGSVRETVSFSDLGAILFTIPPMDTQTKTISVLNAADAEIFALERKLAVLRDQKRFLLNNMVTGSLRLPEFRIGNGE